jgi:arsenite methyltransferase
MTTNDPVREAVCETYAARAREVTKEATDPRGLAARSRFYAGTEALPESIVSYGCGNPIAIAGLEAGEVVLDLGSGAGLDCFLAAQQVGETGRVIGVDMADEMLRLAEQNRAKLGVENVEFRRGLIEAIPVEDASVDVIISNCVINLSTDKDAVFREAHRVLRPGGRFQVSDIVLIREVTEAERADLALWSECKSGAILHSDYAAGLRAAGFVDIDISISGGSDAAWASALINARREGGDATKPWIRPGAQTIEFLAPAGLATADCCAPSGTGDETKCC